MKGWLFSIISDNAYADDIFVNLLRSHLNMKDALLAKGEFFSSTLWCSYSEFDDARWCEGD